MSYLRLDPNYFEKHSTLQLEELIGDRAFWVPIRLKAYAFRCQPDGDFSKFTNLQRQKILGIVNIAHVKQAWDAMHEVGILNADKLVDVVVDLAAAQRRKDA